MATTTKKRVFTGFGAVLLLFLAISLLFRRYFVTVVVSGNSMYPTLKNGQRLLGSNAYWLVGDIRHNDIVVFRDRKKKGEYIIKRVYKLGGETVDWLNVPKAWDLTQGEYIVPKGLIYVLGDNRSESEDSRMFGPLPYSDLVGKVVLLK